MAAQFSPTRVTLAVLFALPVVSASAAFGSETIKVENYPALNKQLQSGDITYVVESGDALLASSGSISIDGSGHSLTLKAEAGRGAGVSGEAQVSLSNVKDLTIAGSKYSLVAVSSGEGSVALGQEAGCLEKLTLLGEAQSQGAAVTIYAKSTEVDGSLTGGFVFKKIDGVEQTLTATKISSSPWKDKIATDFVVESGTIKTSSIEGNIHQVFLGKEDSALSGLYGLDENTAPSVFVRNNAKLSGYVDDAHVASISIQGNGDISFNKTASLEQKLVVDEDVKLYDGSESQATITLESDTLEVGGSIINANATQNSVLSIGTQTHAIGTVTVGNGASNSGKMDFYADAVTVGGTLSVGSSAETIFHKTIDDEAQGNQLNLNFVTHEGTLRIESGTVTIAGNVSGGGQLLLGSSDEAIENLDAKGVFSTGNGQFYVKDAFIDNFNGATATFHDTGDPDQKLAVTQINAGSGTIEVLAGSFEATERLNQNGTGAVKLGTKDKYLTNVSLGTSMETAKYGLRNLGGTVEIYADNVEIGPEGTAVDVFDATAKGSGDSVNSTTIHAGKTLTIYGDIYAGKASSESFSSDRIPTGVNAQVNITADEGAAVAITGDIATYNDTSAESTNEQVRSSVNLDFSKAATVVITGAILDTVVGESASGGSTLALGRSGTWTATADSHVTNLIADGSTINQTDAGQTISVENFSGTAAVNAVGERLADGSVRTSLFSVAEAAEGAAIEAAVAGVTADDVVGQSLKVAEGVSTITRVEGGDLYDDYELTTDERGNVLSESVTVSDKLTSFKGITASSIVQWRNQINHLTKRLGDVRSQPEGLGAWARIYGGEYEWGTTNNVEMTSTTIQAGADGRIGSWIIGGALSYTDSGFDIGNGQGDGDMYDLALYASRLFDGGSYVDIIGRYGIVKNDITAGNMAIDTSSSAFGIGIEGGHQFRFLQQAYIEPQIELSYGFVAGDSDTASNGVTVDQDDYQSLVTRVGFRTGFDFPENAGTIYAHVSYSYDFLGKADATATKVGVRSVNLDEDLGGGWVTYGLGGQFRLSERSFAYGELQRSAGGDVENPWAFNVGFRHVF